MTYQEKRNFFIFALSIVLESEGKLNEEGVKTLLDLIQRFVCTLFSDEEIQKSRALLTILGGNEKFPYEVIRESFRQFKLEEF